MICSVTDKRDIRWAAGLFEAEGCPYLDRHTRTYGREEYAYTAASLSTTDEDIVRTFAHIVGGRVFGPYTGKRGGKENWLWKVRNAEAQRVLKRLLPYMGSRRTEQVVRALNTTELSTPAYKSGGIRWAAGLFEGEGWASLDSVTNKSGEYAYTVAGLTMTDEDVIRNFARIVGGRVFGPYDNKRGVKPLWTWKARNEEGRLILRRLLPYVGHRRTLQIEAVLEKSIPAKYELSEL